MRSKMDLVLHGYWRSSCSWRVRWVLNLKGLTYKNVAVNLLAGEQNAPSYLEINPHGRVPTLLVDQKPISGSLAIVEWLDETWPLPSLLTSDPWEKALIREMAYVIAMDTQPIQNLSVLRKYSDREDLRQEWARDFNRKGLQVFNQLVAQNRKKGSYSFGTNLTMADICLIPQCYNAKRYGVDLEKEFPRLFEIYSFCLTSKPCADSSPDNQPEAKIT
jgi:hypothetical protein